MNIEDEVRFIEKAKNKEYLLLSPRGIRGGVKLVNNYKTMELYKNMDRNTIEFANIEIVNLISKANYDKEEARRDLKLKLVFDGDYDDLPEDMNNPIDIIMAVKDRIVAVYDYVESTEEREFFVGFSQTETIYNYGHLYLNFAILLEEFDQNNIKYNIDITKDMHTRSIYRDDSVTNFVISYNPKKELEEEKGYQLKKEIKNNNS
ncbi:MAG: hypothetical protein VZS44_00655 [Bacilli bacterium]|nr:hypothetical protein [Bacilli bacterium]